MVWVEETVIAPAYTVPVVLVGVVPSVVYRMAAPVVAELKVKVWAVVYTPGLRLNWGVATEPVISYTALATAESAQAVLYAMALSVLDEETRIEPA